MPDDRCKYRREDFGDLPVKLHHLTIHLNFIDGDVEASEILDMTALQPLDAIELDANDLVILGVWRLDSPDASPDGAVPLEYDYREKENKLRVLLSRPVAADERFHIRTLTRCTPSDHILEGIYKDATPEGAPQQYMSQCQQWGFQRIMPIFDDCRAKCTMTTTLEADAAYTHLVSNGNIDLRSNPDGKPVPKPGDPTRQVITYRNDVPMAPYLFIACAGTWEALTDTVTFDSGRTVRLEYLTPPGRSQHARIPMEILKKSILWIKDAQDYEYTGDAYRTITMNKSNFGGMENVGNTTIVTDAALIDEHTLDLSVLYAHAVIVHEFEHNQCGSETTMDTPFDVWLNEAYTVDVERQFMACVFDPSFVRLQQVESIRNPLLGPLAIEDAGHAGRIVRDGFNDPDELIDGVTYVKAAEVIRMLRLLLGADKFKAGKALYFNRYKHANATTDQFFKCFEEASGVSLEQFKLRWLYTIGYPNVVASTAYDPAKQQYKVSLRQELKPGLEPFHFPIVMALVDHKGHDMEGSARTVELRDASAEVVFDGVDSPPAFASMNRDYSFYGTFRCEDATPESLAFQVRLDPNAYNRVDAMRQLTDRQRVRLLNDPEAAIDEEWLRIYGEIIADGSIPSAIKAHFLRIDEQPMDRTYSTWVLELVAAKEKLMRAVNERHRGKLLNVFNTLDTYRATTSPNDGIEDRMLKNTLLDLIAIDDEPDSHCRILSHLDAATTATDRVAALLALNRSSAPERRSTLEKYYEAWHPHLSAYANYLRVISSGTGEDVFDMIEAEKKRPSFVITQPTWCRALFLSMAVNSKKVWTDRGIRWAADSVIELATLSPLTASRFLNVFQHARRLKPVLREKVLDALEQIRAKVTPDISPTIHGQAKAYLGS